MQGKIRRGANRNVVGGELVVEIGHGRVFDGGVLDRQIIEQIAMRAVMDAEIALGNPPHDASTGNLGYDIEV